jgi:hypothetical protein
MMIAMTGDRTGWQDLMEMSVADWMDMTPSDLMEMAYGDMYSMTPSEWLDAAYGQAAAYGRGGGYGDDVYGDYGRGGVRERRGQRHRSDRGRYGKGKGKGKRDRGCKRCRHDEDDCPRCRPDPCQCYCCIGDVDLVVEARLGERRVIPIVIENERRREKEISLELSEWTTRRGGDAPVNTLLITPTEFTLEPCASVEVTIVVDIAGQRDDDGDDDNPPPSDAPPGTGPPGTPDIPGRQRLPDVDDCLVVIADLRIVGCDHRPVRIAIAILPRDCDPYTVSCGCSCC